MIPAYVLDAGWLGLLLGLALAGLGGAIWVAFAVPESGPDFGPTPYENRPKMPTSRTMPKGHG